MPKFSIRSSFPRTLATLLAVLATVVAAGCGNGMMPPPGSDNGIAKTDMGTSSCTVATLSWGASESVIEGEIGTQNVLRIAPDDSPYIVTFRATGSAMVACGQTQFGTVNIYDIVFLEPDGAGGWTETIIDSNVPYVFTAGLSMELDPGSGEPHVAYTGIAPGTMDPAFSCGSHDLVVNARTGATWTGPDLVMADSNTGETCPNGQNACNIGAVTGAWASLAFTSPGNMIISYRDNHNGWNQIDFGMADLEVATGSIGSWTTEVAQFVEGGGGYSSIAVDPAGNPIVAHEDLGNGFAITHRVDDGMGGMMWETMNVTSLAPVERTQIAMDSNGTLYAVFPVRNPAPGLYAAVSTDGGMTWDVQVVDSNGVTGMFPSLRITDDDVPVIASYRCSDPGESTCNVTDDGLRIAYLSCGEWRTTYVGDVNDDAITDGKYPSLDFDSNGDLFIVYQEEFGDAMGNLFESVHMISGAWD